MCVCMRYILLLFLIITQMVFVFGYPAGESEEPIFSGRVAGTVSDTLQFPIREIRDKTPPELDDQLEEAAAKEALRSRPKRSRGHRPSDG